MSSVVLAVLTGVSSVPAGAADNGVGPSDSTGNARACEATGENAGFTQGSGGARGLECPSLLNGYFTEIPNGCEIDVSGSGLQPGTLVWIVTPAFGMAFLGRVSSTGEFSYSHYTGYSCKEMDPAYLTGTSASGDPTRSRLIPTVG